jgi:phosphoribosylaminoimidazolecarboxamide formyltransferase/IMP cyclohydrolase
LDLLPNVGLSELPHAAICDGETVTQTYRNDVFKRDQLHRLKWLDQRIFDNLRIRGGGTIVNIVSKVNNWVKIRYVLISVSEKSKLDVLVPGLIKANPSIRVVSTGGTHAAIAKILGPDAAREHLVQVSEYTGQPETQGGLVKSLDFKIYLGLLTETYNEAHQADLTRTAAIPIDMVVVNLYPFEETVVRKGVTVEEARASIDIGGPSMLRAAAKNYLRVAAIVDPEDYASLVTALCENKGRLSLVQRFTFAQKAFDHTAHYDSAIAKYLAQQEPARMVNVYEWSD